MKEEYSQEELDAILKNYTGLSNLDISNKPKKIIKQKQQQVIVQEEDSITNEEIVIAEKPDKILSVPIISLVNWVRRYGRSIPSDMKVLEFNIVGISNDEYLLIKVPHPKGGNISPGVPRKELLMFKGANKIPVLDLDISEISIYGSGIRMVHPFNNGFIKCYTGKPNYLVAAMANDQLIPYYITKVKNNNLLVYKENTIELSKVINERVDREKIKTLYNIILKEEEWKNMKTNGDVFNYFLNLQKNIKDNAHHIKIDNIMIGMVIGKFPTDQNIATHVSYQIQYI